MGILELAGVRKAFGPVDVLVGVDLEVHAGTVHALIGPNGAGKSTLLHTIAGNLRADGGSVVFDGEDLGSSDGIERARRGLSLQMQIPSVFGGLRVLDNLQLAAAAPGRARPATAAQLHEVLELVRLAAVADLPARDLSHGQLKWLELGLCLLTRPRLLLLDEPTAGMTQRERAETAPLIAQLIEDRRVESVIVVEHDMGFVRKVCSTVSMLHRGTVLDTGDFSTLAASAAAKEAYLGAG